ncbi:MAG: hypothetical protein JRH20_25120 [Deltaproteobacteria bacterium]|nr:hypothetical protein [Deltaproteobacteria bacterium]
MVLNIATRAVVLFGFLYLLAPVNAEAGCFDTQRSHSRLYQWPKRPFLVALQRGVECPGGGKSVMWQLLNADGSDADLWMLETFSRVSRSFDRFLDGKGDSGRPEMKRLKAALGKTKAKSWIRRASSTVKALGLVLIRRSRACAYRVRVENKHRWQLVARKMKAIELESTTEYRYSHVRCYPNLAVVRRTPEDLCGAYKDIYIPLPKSRSSRSP